MTEATDTTNPEAAADPAVGVDALVSRLRHHYQQMAPHVKDRKTAHLLREATERIAYLQEALSFYAEDDNYWSSPLALDGTLDRVTIRAVRQAEEDNFVLQDRGHKARKALSD